MEFLPNDAKTILPTAALKVNSTDFTQQSLESTTASVKKRCLSPSVAPAGVVM